MTTSSHVHAIGGALLLTASCGYLRSGRLSRRRGDVRGAELRCRSIGGVSRFGNVPVATGLAERPLLRSAESGGVQQWC